MDSPASVVQPVVSKLRPRRSRLSWIIIWLVVAFGIWAVIVHYNDLKNIVQILGSGRWQLVIIAAALQFCSYFLYAEMYQATFAAVSIKSGTWKNLAVYLESLLPSIIVPAGNIAFFLRSVRESGQSTTSAAVALLLVRVADLISFCVLFLVGLTYSAFTGQLQGFEVVSAEILLVVSLALVGALAISAQQPKILEWLLHRVEKTVNLFSQIISKKPVISTTWAAENSHTFSNAIQGISSHRVEAKRAVLLALCTHLLDLLTIFLLFLAFRQSIGLGSLLVGFVIGLFFALVPITPQGVGTIEGAMILAYSHLGMSTAAATVVTIAFRGLSFWLPAIVGLVLIQGRALLRIGGNAHK